MLRLARLYHSNLLLVSLVLLCIFSTVTVHGLNPISTTNMISLRHFGFKIAPQAASNRIISYACAGSRSSRLFATKASPEAPQKIFLLKYAYVPDIVEKRGPYRAAHLSYANEHVATGFMVAGGALNPPSRGGMLTFRGTREAVDAFAKDDPYFKAGLITDYSIDEWTVVLGEI